MRAIGAPTSCRNFQASPDFQLRWVCDQSIERAERVVGSQSAVRTTANLQEILDDDSVTAVAVATPAHTHRAIAGAALEAGKHVLVEKPLAASVDEADELVQLAAASSSAC